MKKTQKRKCLIEHYMHVPESRLITKSYDLLEYNKPVTPEGLVISHTQARSDTESHR